MIRFSENYPLKNHNTFGIDARAKFYFEVTEPADLFVFTQSTESLRDEPLLAANLLKRPLSTAAIIDPEPFEDSCGGRVLSNPLSDRGVGVE